MRKVLAAEKGARLLQPIDPRLGCSSRTRARSKERNLQVGCDKYRWDWAHEDSAEEVSCAVRSAPEKSVRVIKGRP